MAPNHKSERSARYPPDPNRMGSKHQSLKATISDLVYRYLSIIADKDARRKQRSSACQKFRKEHARRKDVRRPNVSSPSIEYRKRHTRPKDVHQPNISPPTNRATESTKSEKSSNRCDQEAKKYVRDALFFAIQSGYITVPKRWQRILRISSNLRPN